MVTMRWMPLAILFAATWVGTSLTVTIAAEAPVREPATACAPGAVPLLIVGSFHMAGSTQDAVQRSPADMTTPARRAELDALVQSLSRFGPTRVAIESSRTSTVWNDRYAAWPRGAPPPGTNEIELLAFPVARAAKLAALSPVDYPMWMDGTQAIDRQEPRAGGAPPASAAPATLPASRLLVDVMEQVAADDAHLATHTVAEHLAWLDAPARARASQRWDVLSNLAPASGTSRYETTDFATNWYKRNLRLYTNLVDLAAPGERILLLIGAGHVHLLRGLAQDDPRFCLAELPDYLPR